ncbi:hypothetical protein SARC_13562 [Sphaeroforma arctica JP610]|uniref:Uncharacterized protein n=1 Tax=Sphaeroforma arctica JP610 TaxID=667725 RepID=A0A0L0FAV7_9EUKA|nr:hypothetical protein SARC_13562 [Sphaeroforma arctica JP610]KNC73879.1 hypothetical protein SARC_13562 [Sphaeroforma arctica JP610]|eukprot:XP_014147781.1 hypothetical protein SARC_13562 [Sphaeroforma arctica JP610]
MRRLFSHTLHKLKNESKLDLMTRVHRLESDKDEMSLRLSSLKDSSKRMARSLWQRTYWYYLALMLVIFAVTPQGVLPEVVDDMSRNATATMLGYHPIDYMFPAERGVSGGSLGRRLAAEGLQKHHPVLLIPGFTTVSLELWKPHPGEESVLGHCAGPVPPWIGQVAYMFDGVRVLDIEK